MTSPSRRIVVCGTDTDVGKTVVSAWLVQGLEASYWKPIQSGLDGGGDRERVRHLLIFPRSGCSLRPLPLASQCRRIGPLSSIKAHCARTIEPPSL
jgi:dethiobiotin synthetase